MISTEEDDLQVPFIPGGLWKNSFQIVFSSFDRSASGQAPSGSQAVYVGVDRECGHPKGLGHNDACSLMANARKGL
jgi:hypothetical protein